MGAGVKSTDAAIVTGLLWLASTLLLLFVDPVRGWQTQDDFYRAVAASPSLYQLPRIVLGATAFVGMAAVLEISRVLQNGASTWLRWSKLLAILGLALTGVSQVRFALINPARASIYVEGDVATRLAIEANRLSLQLDPNAVMSTLFLVVWLVVVNRLSLATKRWPLGASLLGFAVFLVAVAGISARALSLLPITQLTSLINGLLAPAWFLWVGVALHTRRAA